jgi:hypothetical protein
LSDRTATYTNSFKLPNTPTNAQQLSFAGSVSVRVNPSIEVTIQKGLFQKKAVLKVVSFDSDYSCSVSYDQKVVDKLKLQDLDIFGTYPIPTETAISPSLTPQDCITQLFIQSYTGSPVVTEFFPIKTHSAICSNILHQNGNIGTKIQTYFDTVATLNGITFSGTLFSDADFLKMYIMLPNYGFNLVNESGTYHVYYDYFQLNYKQIYASDVIKAVCQLFFADIKIQINNVVLDKIDITSDVEITTSLNVSKVLSSGYANINRIVYDVEDKAKTLFGSDSFIAEGLGEKDVLKLICHIPKTDSVGYVTDVTKTAEKLLVFSKNATPFLSGCGMYDDSDTLITAAATLQNANILSMGGYYSAILQPIFEKPIILEVTCILNSLTANDIINTRVIKSLQLGGRYWVDSMAHDLTTGNTKMKLIKLK